MAIGKGRWFRRALRDLARDGIRPDLSVRSAETFAEELTAAFLAFAGNILRALMPLYWRQRLQVTLTPAPIEIDRPRRPDRHFDVAQFTCSSGCARRGSAAGIVTIPFVTLTLGTEALGLVGVYSTLLAMLGLFDLGLPMAANHRLAVLIGRNAAPAEQAVLVRTLEMLFWGMGALFLVVGFGSRSLLASSWLNASVIPQPTVDAALAAMIATVAVRFPVSFYTNILFARDRHVFPNAVTAASAATSYRGKRGRADRASTQTSSLSSSSS